MKEKGALIVISGPSGSGKSTVAAELLKYRNFSLSISATTRAPREYEKEGEHYFFKSKDEFLKLRDNGELLEWAEFCGNYYGTPLCYVEQELLKGKNVILEIEVQGGLMAKSKYPECILVFVLPPDMKTLRERLSGRGTEKEDVIEKRLKRALEEINIAIKKYDYVTVNDRVEDAAEDLYSITRAEILKSHKNELLNNFLEER